jgi:hypothetical protein
MRPGGRQILPPTRRPSRGAPSAPSVLSAPSAQYCTGPVYAIFTRWFGVRALCAERNRDVLLWRNVSDLQRDNRRVHVYVRHRGHQ